MYRTVFAAVILSEEPLPETLGLSDALAEADTGSYVGTYRVVREEKLTDAEMAQALLAAGSDPEFFDLDIGPTDDDDTSGVGVSHHAEIREIPDWCGPSTWSADLDGMPVGKGYRSIEEAQAAVTAAMRDRHGMIPAEDASA